MTTCYGAGTHILTDRGEVRVEQLGIGDRVLTADGTPRPVKWIGYRHLDLTRHPEPELVQPILIRTDAIADGVPHRDLSVSPDHALLLDGVLVPARLLINGASIRRDTACKAVTYYHVELDTHDVLLAENLPAESYLDTGNRGTFENSGATLVLHPDLSTDQDRRIAQSCRPFADTPILVEPIWRRLAQRSLALGLELPADIPTTSDPGLYVTVGGRAIKPISSQDGRYVFLLPKAEGPIHLVSHTTKPCDLRPWVEDHRRLGVMVSHLALRSDRGVDLIPLDHPGLSRGWWAVERDQSTFQRWTNGNAVIPLTINGPAVLEITIAGTLDYPVHESLAATGLSSELVKAA